MNDGSVCVRFHDRCLIFIAGLLDVFSKEHVHLE